MRADRPYGQKLHQVPTNIKKTWGLVRRNWFREPRPGPSAHSAHYRDRTKSLPIYWRNRPNQILGLGRRTTRRQARRDSTEITRNEGFSLGPKLPALVRTLRLQKMYITNHNAIEIKVPLHSFGGKAEAKALVDSGATENFIDHRTVIKLRLGTRKLQKSRTVYNVDRTLNRDGTITHSCELFVKQGNK